MMGEERFFCYIPHILGCKIYGGIQVVLNAVYLALDIHSLLIVNERFDHYFDRQHLSKLGSRALVALRLALRVRSGL